MLYCSNISKRIRHRTSDLMDLLTTHSLSIDMGKPMPFIHDFRELIHGYTAISLPKDVIAIVKEQGVSFPHDNYTVLNFISSPFEEYVPMTHLNPYYYDNLVGHINDTMTKVYHGLDQQHQYVLKVRHRKIMEALKLEEIARQPPAQKRRKVDMTDVCYYETD